VKQTNKKMAFSFINYDVGFPISGSFTLSKSCKKSAVHEKEF